MERAKRIHEYVVELRKVLSDSLRYGKLAGPARRCCDGNLSSTRSDRLWSFVLHCRASGKQFDSKVIVQQVTT